MTVRSLSCGSVDTRALREKAVQPTKVSRVELVIHLLVVLESSSLLMFQAQEDPNR